MEMMRARESVVFETITLILIIVILCPSAYGTVIYVDDDAAGSNDGSSWADAYRCLQNALADTRFGDEIRVAQGTYKPDLKEIITARGSRVIRSGDRTDTFQLVNGVAIKGGYAGFGEPDPDARDLEGYKTILSGDLNSDDGPNFTVNSENSYHVVTGNGTDETAVLDGFTITGGNANGPDWESQGGGMFNRSGSPTVTNCTFENNSATNSGGGMSNFISSPTLTNCVFNRNSTNNNGGGILCGRASSPTITNCMISENTAGFWGGGIECHDSSPTIIDCTISGNAASVAPYSATGGGGIHCRDSSPTIIDCIISGNTTGSGTTDSGGIGCTGSSPTIINCTISSNTSTNNAGGIGCYWNSSPTITNCIIAGNTTGHRGGGIYCYESSSPIITNCIIVGNVANSGGGIRCYYSSPIITNSILWGDTPEEIYGGTPVITYSDVQDGWAGEGNINADPLFVDAANADYHLQEGSSCIDAGDNSAIPQTVVEDFDGNPRINDSIVDMGAYEFGIALPPTTLSEALDTDLSFTTSGDADWLGQTTTSYYGEDAAQSGDISHNQESWMQTTVSGAGTVAFYWKVSSEVGYDFLEFYIDGSLQEEVSGLMDDWEQETYTISTLDSHMLEWRYVKDKGTDFGSDCGWVDMVEWVPTHPPAPLSLAFNPNPADGAEYVYPDVELSWSPGDGAQLHIVHFGDNFDDVNSDAGGILLETTTYTPGPLEFDKVYYWRVDEFDGVVIHKGKVWSFGTEGVLE